MKCPGGVDVGPVEVGKSPHHEHLTQLGIDTAADLPSDIGPNWTSVGNVPLTVGRANSAVVGKGVGSNASR